ncbi:hypothetical protein ACKI1I_33905 [Streptomyces turgidiscabies]|uniref:Uncharacterized protein n=1 Tax=Streptomyces turgidiscabies (strain Car8) TaxID=698760 RepID=L7ETA9_STRT8|nr:MULTISPECIES: hypothetical protein [Streptomyces]ELP61625.1 hypothetical protein STRTUCAR8_04712 [Streptomyces turgidiscabies Car8]MDX3498701.1 hypothetical protein [Streptomyces turgidiscabies]GAQ74873.1 hypothetical protein T45_06654 [Streptomyces turgidiscabies]
MKTPATASPPPFPHVALLRPHQQMAIDRALCARPLEAGGLLQWDGQRTPFYACEPCPDRLKAQALGSFTGWRPATV